MRFAYILAAALAAAPLPAHDAAEAPRSEMAETLSDPALQSGVAGMLSALLETVLDLRIGPIAEAMEDIDPDAAARMDKHATLRDMAGPDADRLPDEVAARVPQMMGMMAGMAQSMEELRPVLEDLGERMKEVSARSLPADNIS